MSDLEQPLGAALERVDGLGERLTMARLKDGVATILIDASGLGAEQRAMLERQVRAALVGIAGVVDVRVAMTAEKVQRRIIAVGSGKGGVGKSTLSANLAIALARLGKKVGLIDADIYGPSQPRIMGNHGRPELIDQQIVPIATHGVRRCGSTRFSTAGRSPCSAMP